MKLFFVGCGRCGTTYISAYCRSAGLNIPHEGSNAGSVPLRNFNKMRYGDSCGHLAAAPHLLVGHRVVHVVRHPLKCVASLTTCGEKSFAWGREQYKHLPDFDVVAQFWVGEKVARAATHYVFWNRLCEAVAATRFKIEEADSVLPLILAEHGWSNKVSAARAPSKKTNTRKHKNFTVSDFESCLPPTLLALLRDSCTKYGYVWEDPR